MWQVIATIMILIAGASDPSRKFEVPNHHKFASERSCELYMLSEEFRETVPPLVAELESQMRGHPGKLTIDFNCRQEGVPA